MTRRPTHQWRRQVLAEADALAAGSLTAADARAARLWPPSFIDAVDAVFDGYEAEVRALRAPSDDDVFGAVERVVRALNEIDEQQHGLDTVDREELCEYIDEVLAAAGVDVDALTARRGVDRAELTDFWREW